MRIGLLLSLVVVALGSLLFGRYDWTGIPLARNPATDIKVVSERCTAQIQPYTTESGRVVGPIVIDEQQYMALVQYYRGVPRDQLQIGEDHCLFDPFTFRSGTSWIAHWLPFEEGLSLSIVNLSGTLLALWFLLLTLRALGYSPRVVLTCGALFAVSWNVLFFGAAILVDATVVALVALGAYLLALRRPWLLCPVLLLGYPIKETVGILVPVLFVWAFQEYRAGRRTLARAAAPAVVAAACFVVGVAFWRGALPSPDAAWPVTPNLSSMGWNLGNPFGLIALLVGAFPYVVLAFLGYRVRARAEGWFHGLIDWAVVGVVIALGINFWAFITVKTSPRLFWIGIPFCLVLAARWLAQGRAGDSLERLRLPASLVG
ncbi:MAG: hypothetical protein ACOYOP_00920 [Microthrixaceae bacterium]